MAVIRNEDRTAYLTTFDEARDKNNMKPFYELVEDAVERSLTAYINAGQGKSVMNDLSPTPSGGELLKIGELAKATNQTVPTLRFWTREGLLQVKSFTEGGYQLYEPIMIDRVQEIRRLQSEARLTLQEIKQKFK
jgi:hypothetical protein